MYAKTTEKSSEICVAWHNICHTPKRVPSDAPQRYPDTITLCVFWGHVGKRWGHGGKQRLRKLFGLK